MAIWAFHFDSMTKLCRITVILYLFFSKNFPVKPLGQEISFFFFFERCLAIDSLKVFIELFSLFSFVGNFA